MNNSPDRLDQHDCEAVHYNEPFWKKDGQFFYGCEGVAITKKKHVRVISGLRNIDQFLLHFF